MHVNSLEFNERKEECDESFDAVEESENDGFHVAEKSKKSEKKNKKKS